MGKITELSRGSLNGLRRQTNECLKNAYNKGYEDGKKEPREVKAVNVEDTSEYQIGYKVGYEDGTNRNLQGYYNKGLEDVNHALGVLKAMTGTECAEWFENYVGIDDVVCTFTIQRIIENTKAYEEKKKAEEESIKVGDVVKFNENCHNYDHVKSREYLVLHIFDNGLVTLLYDNGDTGAVDISLVDKTGRHIDVTEQLLDKLKGDNNESNN